MATFSLGRLVELGAEGSVDADVDGHGAADPIAAADLSVQQTPVRDVLPLVYPEGIQLGLLRWRRRRRRPPARGFNAPLYGSSSASASGDNSLCPG
jgi:hypothetical protein